MDLNTLKNMSGDPLPDDSIYDVTRSHYTLILLPPSFDWPQETFACVVHAPAFNYSGGVVRAFNLNKSSAGNLVGGQCFFNSDNRLLRAYKEFIPAIVDARKAKIIWEGNINGFNTQVGSFFESPWFN